MANLRKATPRAQILFSLLLPAPHLNFPTHRPRAGVPLGNKPTYTRGFPDRLSCQPLNDSFITLARVQEDTSKTRVSLWLLLLRLELEMVSF